MASQGSKTSKIVLITGATSGIGRHTALQLARRGFRVIATGRKADALAALERDAAGTSLETLVLDVTSADSIAAALAAVDARTNGHGLDALVNNAGYGTAGPAEMCTDADLRAQYDTNVFGLMAVTRAFLPAMRERGAGRVINVSSVGGKVTMPMMGVYNSTKYAVESLTDALRIELAPFGVRCALIEPGAIHTGFAERSLFEAGKYQDDASPYAGVMAHAQELKDFADRSAVGPDCVANAIEHALRARRPRARYMVPFRYRIALGFLRVLPTRWIDGLMRKAAGISRERLGLTGKRAGKRAAQLDSGARA
jgi:short-subunit dehydrogenase